jgi:hypothetical protein
MMTPGQHAGTGRHCVAAALAHDVMVRVHDVMNRTHDVMARPDRATSRREMTVRMAPAARATPNVWPSQ